VKGTSFSSVKKDLVNAGATWIDQEVAIDGMLITSRKPEGDQQSAQT
jgi:protease I